MKKFLLLLLPMFVFADYPHWLFRVDCQPEIGLVEFRTKFIHNLNIDYTQDFVRVGKFYNIEEMYKLNQIITEKCKYKNKTFKFVVEPILDKSSKNDFASNGKLSLYINDKTILIDDVLLFEPPIVGNADRGIAVDILMHEEYAIIYTVPLGSSAKCLGENTIWFSKKHTDNTVDNKLIWQTNINY